MRILLYLCLLFIVSCCSDPITTGLDLDPNYSYGDIAKYKVNNFYKNICSGEGTVVAIPFKSRKVIHYKIQIPEDEVLKGCKKEITIMFKRKNK